MYRLRQQSEVSNSYITMKQVTGMCLYVGWRRERGLLIDIKFKREVTSIITSICAFFVREVKV